jgi:hypothetical protein
MARGFKAGASFRRRPGEEPGPIGLTLRHGLAEGTFGPGSALWITMSFGRLGQNSS